MVTRIVPNKRGKEIIRRLRKDKSVKKISVKFEDGNASKEVLKAYKKHSPVPRPKRFQHPNGTTMVIYDENNTELYRFRGAIPKKRLAKIVSRYPRATILIDLGSGIYKQIPIKTFKKMIK